MSNTERPVNLADTQRARVTDLAMKATDLHQPRHVRECGADTLNMLAQFDRYKLHGCSNVMAANFVDSIIEAADMLADMTQEGA